MHLMLFSLASCAAIPAKQPSQAVRRVVLVHGFLETGSTFRMMKKRLEKCGFDCFVPRLYHSDGRGGLAFLATHLKRDIDAHFGSTAPISIVAFSMGGLVSREYLQNQGGAQRCKQLITVSSPHQGTKAAWIYPSRGAVEMRPGSQFLVNLGLTQDRLGKMPITSYRTPLDLIILPSTSSVWQRADNVEYPVILHPMMLTSKRVLNDIERRLG